MMNRRHVLGVMGAAAFGPVSAKAMAQAASAAGDPFPSRPITLWVGVSSFSVQ
jgi:hypothetical protein